MKKSGEERGGRGLTLRRDYKPEAPSPPIKLNYPKEGIQLRELLLNTKLFSPVLLSFFLAFHETILNFQKLANFFLWKLDYKPQNTQCLQTMSL